MFITSFWNYVVVLPVVLCIFNISAAEVGMSLPSNEVLERRANNQRSLSNSSNGRQQCSSDGFRDTPSPPLAYPSAGQTSDPNVDHPSSRRDEQIHRRWPGLRPLVLSPLRGSDLSGQLHRPKPIRLRPYSDVPSTVWQHRNTTSYHR